MAGETDVLEPLRQLFQAAQRDVDWNVLVARWTSEGLPAAPSEGEPGREQLAIAAGLLRELSVELRSLVEIGQLAPEGYAFAAVDSSGDQAQLRRSRVGVGALDGVLEWSEQLRGLAATIEEFIQSGNRR